MTYMKRYTPILILNDAGNVITQKNVTVFCVQITPGYFMY